MNYTLERATSAWDGLQSYASLGPLTVVHKYQSALAQVPYHRHASMMSGAFRSFLSILLLSIFSCFFFPLHSSQRRLRGR